MVDRPDIVHIEYEVNTFGPIYSNVLLPILLLLIRISKAKIIVTLHSVFTVEKEVLPLLFKRLPEIILRVFAYLFYKFVGMLTHGVVVHSSAFKKLLIKYYSLSKDKLYVIPHGVDDFNPTIDQSRVKHDIPYLRDNKVILCFGVLSPRKGLEYLIKGYSLIASKYPEYVLVIAGYEPPYYKGYKNKLEALTKSLGIEHRVFFLGFVKDEDIPSLFSISEIVVLPYSHSMSASGSLSLAIQYRKPIIATRTTFFNEFLEDGRDSLLVPPRNPQEIAKALEKLLKDSSLKKRIAQNLVFKAYNYSWRNVAKMTLQTYVDVIGFDSKSHPRKLL
jgi:glycosyltransferase involved in cell wall biosynthesis